MKKIIGILIITSVLGISNYLLFSRRIPEINTIQSEVIDFHKLATKKEYANILKLFNPVIDEKNRKLYVVGSKTTNVGVIDLNKDELIDTFDIGIFGGFLFFNDQKLYSFDFSQNKCFEIDTKNKKAIEIPIDTCTELTPQDKGKPKELGNYSFLETGYQSFPDGTTGFPTDWTQNLNGAYGVIEISDSLTGKKVGEIVHGPDANFFTIDNESKKLYTTNTGDGSISIFDLNKLEETNYCEKNSCLIKEIDVGNSVDQLIIDSIGNFYVRNRLGGSTLFKYNPIEKSFVIIDNEKKSSHDKAIWNGNWQGMDLGMWPTDMALSQDEKKLYVLSHYEALIDIVDTTSNKVTTKINFDTTLKPRTDSISAMTLNKPKDKPYVAWPELGLIGVADGTKGKALGTIDLTKYGFDKTKATNRGPGFINIAVDDNTDLLYVYLFNEQKMLVFDGTTLEKKNEAVITLKNKGEGLLMINPNKKEFYLGNIIYSLETLKEIDFFSRGQKVQSFNSKTDAIYLSELIASSNIKFKKSLKIYEFIAGSQTKEWTIDNLGEIANTFFDFKNNNFYIADFLSGTVIKKSLAESSAPTTVSISPSPTNTQVQKPIIKPEAPIKPTQGKCGDGICQPIEKEKNACQEDCK